MNTTTRRIPVAVSEVFPRPWDRRRPRRRWRRRSWHRLAISKNPPERARLNPNPEKPPCIPGHRFESRDRGQNPEKSEQLPGKSAGISSPWPESGEAAATSRDFAWNPETSTRVPGSRLESRDFGQSPEDLRWNPEIPARIPLSQPESGDVAAESRDFSANPWISSRIPRHRSGVSGFPLR
jgi:hypothetical protein